MEITQKVFMKTHLLPLSPPDIGTNHQACLAGTQQSNKDKVDDIGGISKSSIVPIDMEEVSTTDPMVILREKRSCRASRNLLISTASYDTVRDRTVLTLNQINTVKR